MRKKYLYIRLHRELYAYLKEEAFSQSTTIGKRLSQIIESALDDIDAEEYEYNLNASIYNMNRDPTKKEAANPIHVSVSNENYEKLMLICERMGKKQGAILNSILLGYLTESEK